MTIYTQPYCVYLTVYLGNKMPPFYIGSTSVERITKRNYHGTVKSREWRETWKQELHDHPEFFKTKIICYHESREEAQAKEADLQTRLNVLKKPGMYINRAIMSEKVCFDWSGKKRSEQSNQKRAESLKKIWQSDEFRQMMSTRLRGRPMPDTMRSKQSERVRGRVWCYHPDTLESRQVPPTVFEELSSVGFLPGKKPKPAKPVKIRKKRQFSEEERKKLADRMRAMNKGKPKHHSEETRRKLSEAHRGKPKLAFRAFRWWNDGAKNARAVECPGENWSPGMLKRS
jgi:hypothetical protein